ncbi:MAG: hypothetical protein V7L14_11990 [Nostoc sp.]|uniref:hypothetical protein n=1 Tax=Nostoc sp. TaxID=1180 RepID=UPI002FFB7946
MPKHSLFQQVLLLSGELLTAALRDRFASRVEIVSGLTGNERVVAKGAYGLADSTLIEEVKQ